MYQFETNTLEQFKEQFLEYIYRVEPSVQIKTIGVKHDGKNQHYYVILNTVDGYYIPKAKDSASLRDINVVYVYLKLNKFDYIVREVSLYAELDCNSYKYYWQLLYDVVD